MGEGREGDVAGDGGVSANDDFVVLAGAGCDEFQNVSTPVSAMTPVATARPSRSRVVRWCGRALSARRLPTARGLFARRRSTSARAPRARRAPRAPGFRFTR